MNEDNTPDKDGASNRPLMFAKLAMVAGVLGLAVGAGLYAFSERFGNAESSGPLASASCAIDETLRASLDNNSGGHVAAFTALDRPISVAPLGFKDFDGQAKSLCDLSGPTTLFNFSAT